MTTHPEVSQAYYDQVLAPRLEQATRVVQRAQTRGEVRQDLDATEILSLLAGPIWYHLLFNENTAPLASGLPERLVDALLQGIARQKKPEEGGVDATLRDAQGQ